MKFKINKKNKKNCQNQGPEMRFLKSKDLIVEITIP